MAAQDLTPQIATNATGPQSAETQAGSMVARTSADVIAADRYGKAAAGAKTRRRGLRFSKIIPAGTVSDQQSTGIGGNLGGFGGRF